MTDDKNKVTQADELAAADHIATFEELKRRTPVYMGEEPKPRHYQRIHAAYDAAIVALRSTDRDPAQVMGEADDYAHQLQQAVDLATYNMDNHCVLAVDFVEGLIDFLSARLALQEQ